MTGPKPDSPVTGPKPDSPVTGPKPDSPVTGPEPGWVPANDVESALAASIAAGRRQEYFQLILTSELYLPAFVETDPDARQRFVTMNLYGRPYLPVFTAPIGLARAVGTVAGAYTVTTYAELRDKWPSPEWRLAINPGSPIDAFMTVESVEAAARGDVRVPTAAELMAEARLEALANAVAAGDGDGFLDTLLDCDVFVPARSPVHAVDIFAPEFPWHVTWVPVDRPRPDEPATRPTIEVVAMPGSPPTGPGVVVPFLALVTAWPDSAYQLAVLAAGRTVTIPGADLAALAVTAASVPADGVDQ